MVIALAPWMIKNALLANNPFFPFFMKIFPTRQDLIPSAQTLFRMHGFPGFEGTAATKDRILGIFPLLTWDASWIIILSLILVPVSFIISIKKRERRMFCGIQLLMALFILYYGKNAQVRWYLGFSPILVLGFVLALKQFLGQHPSLRRAVVISLVGFIFLIWGRQYQLYIRETRVNPLTGFSTRAEEKYLKQESRFREAEFLNAAIPEKGKVLLYDMEIMSTGRWMRRRFVQAGYLWFEKWERQKADPCAILNDLRAMGVTHIATIYHENETFRNFKRSRLEEIKSGSRYSLYIIRTQPDPAPGMQKQRQGAALFLDLIPIPL